MFGCSPKANVQSPLEHGDHPELDDTELLDGDGTQQYQSLIGAVQWCITLGRLDIACAVMSMSSFHVAPRRGHLEWLKQICRYLSKMADFKIRFRTHQPDFSSLKTVEQDWHSVYGEVKELIPENIPPPLGKPVQLTHYVDANLFHNALNG